MTSISSIRTVHDVAGFAAVADFFSDVWQSPRSAPPLLPETLNSLAHAGGAVHAAYDGERLVGASVAVFGPPASRETYSILTAAERGLGFQVKQAQRRWALEHGARTMRWTFDPLVGRNARFNLVKLGAEGTDYLIDFYGPMADGVNDGDESDRLTVTWDLTAPARSYGEPGGTVEEVLGEAAEEVIGETADRGAAPATHTAPDGEPLARRALDDRYIWCRVPDDVVALRAADPALALRWRRAVREVLTKAFADGFTATAMSRDGWYTLTRREAAA
ncbi:chorismate synthase [Streptomyces sp. HD]|uniref:chorismate synthase n=1 Tax=Streptomyces sp. HD TaxID=3020892 RepID=UPI00232D8EC8|nr:chorismate synthase [Streptomyces sp. HD]MDC0769197.1 chorismate synthase [Streptomyces sp. HD]